MAGRDRELFLKLARRVKELKIEEGKSLLRQRTEGQLLKFTNVVKGYQYRWFVIDPDAGTIEYYEKEDHKRLAKPRGVLNLVYASICPSDEDSQAFVINAANGDLLRLKALGPKERQDWVNRLRVVAEYHSDRADSHPPIATLSGPVENGVNHNQTNSTTTTTIISNNENSNHSNPNLFENERSSPTDTIESLGVNQKDVSFADVNTFPIFCPGRPSEPRAQLGELFRQLEQEALALSAAVDSASIRSPEITDLFKNLLLSKATSQAALSCLKRCVELIKRQDTASINENGCCSHKSGYHNCYITQKLAPLNYSNTTINNSSSSHRTSSSGGCDNCSLNSTDKLVITPGRLAEFPPPIKGMDFNAVNIPKFDDENIQQHNLDEHNIGSVEEHKTIILHLLSQLKLDMDMTKVTLPTFILEKRSLLEMFADYMAHPDLFIGITDPSTAEERIVAFVKWYMSTFHTGHKDTVARKPYNPIVGETFHCSWLVSPNKFDRKDITTTTTTTSEPASSNLPPNQICIRYCAEQVSHCPPVTAIHFSCPARRMELTASIYTKSKFHGMSISASLLGKFVLKLGEHNDEEYQFSLPTAYARSILTTPWVELGGKVIINCPQTGCSANIIFHTKPHYGDKLHQIDGEVYGPPVERSQKQQSTNWNNCTNNNANLIARLSGSWNRKIEFDFSMNNKSCGNKLSLDVTQLPSYKKRVRPITGQQPEESQHLWQHVSAAIAAGHTDIATEKKRELEDQQRLSEKYRLNHRFAFPVKYFSWDESCWTFNSYLKQDIQYRSESRTA